MSDVRLVMMEGIARRRIVEATYNSTVITLAPHLLFERHGDLYLSALNLNKNWRSDEDPRLGQFKIAGLASAAILEEEFEPLPNFMGEAPRPDDTVLLKV